MTDTANKSTCTVRVTIRLRPWEYDELSRHVRENGSTMTAFFRESAAKAMKEGHGGREDKVLTGPNLDCNQLHSPADGDQSDRVGGAPEGSNRCGLVEC